MQTKYVKDKIIINIVFTQVKNVSFRTTQTDLGLVDDGPVLISKLPEVRYGLQQWWPSSGGRSLYEPSVAVIAVMNFQLCICEKTKAIT